MPTLTVRITDALDDAIRDAASEQRVTVSDFAREALQAACTPEVRTSGDVLQEYDGKAFEALHAELETKNKQISELHALLGMNGKTVDSLSSQLEAIRLEDKRPFWKRLLGQR